MTELIWNKIYCLVVQSISPIHLILTDDIDMLIDEDVKRQISINVQASVIK